MTGLNSRQTQICREGTLANGYKPVPVLTGKKFPIVDRWEQLAASATPESIKAWPASHGSTGILCGRIVGLDIDVTDPDLSFRLELDAYEMLGLTPLRRVGRAPKVLLPYRCDTLFAKQQTSVFGGHKIEALGHNNQFVAFGIHPDTGKPYEWYGGDPATVPASALPVVTPDQVRKFLTHCVTVFEAAGLTGSQRIASTSHATRERRLSALAPPDADTAVNLLERLPNPIEVGRDDYIAVMFSVRGCIQGLEAEGRLGDDDEQRLADAAIAWAQRWEGGSEHDERAKWERDFSDRDNPLAGWPNLEKFAGRFIPGYRAEIAAAAFAASPVEIPPDLPVSDWRFDPRLVRGVPKKNKETEKLEPGAIKPLINNACIALEQAPEFKGRLSYSTFSHHPFFDGKKVTDDTVTVVTNQLQRLGVEVSSNVTKEAIRHAASSAQQFHEVRDWIETRPKWDNVPRIGRWLIDHCGAEDNEFNRAVGARFLIGMIARVMKPGCKLDTILVLEGRQGLQKSSALKALVGDAWFADQMPDIGSKDAFLQLPEKWLIEMAEMDSINRAETSQYKKFLSSSTDRYRKPYNSATEDVPRQCVFAGTRNPNGQGSSKDETGNRREWSVPCGVGWPDHKKIDVERLHKARDQLFAEAYTAYLMDEVWYLDTPQLEAMQMRIAKDRFDEDVWTDDIRKFLSELSETSIADILSAGLGKSSKEQSQQDKNRVARVLMADGWDRRRTNHGRRYFRPANLAIAKTEPHLRLVSG